MEAYPILLAWRKLFAALVLVSFVFPLTPSQSAFAGHPVENLLVENLLLNGGFEDGSYLPDEWGSDAYTSGSIFLWDSTQAHSGTRSAKLSSTQPNDARWVQAVRVLPNSEYRLSGWIKTENVATSDAVDTGANLSIVGIWSHTPKLLGTNPWTYVELTFNTGTSTFITIGARLGFYSGLTSGTAWFDDIRLDLISVPVTFPNKLYLPAVSQPVPCPPSSSPSWKILVNIYTTTDFSYTDSAGQPRHFYAKMSQAEVDKVRAMSTRFVIQDIPLLNSCSMVPTLTVRVISQPVAKLSTAGCNDYTLSPLDAAAERDPAFDSMMSIWDGSGLDVNTMQSLTLQGCAYGWNMGTKQTYLAIPADMISSNQTNVFKHEWGHSITFYFAAAGTAPMPAVDNHINDTTTRYVNCTSGASYVLQDETDDNPIPNSIYNNLSGFTHDYYSGQTALSSQPGKCLGITASAWAAGGPVTKP